jgi:predicted NACHT family NTPase
LIGDAGAGKSTFTRQLAHILWREYRPGGTIILFISLPTIKDPVHNLIHEHLEEKGKFSKDQIQDLKENRRFVLILDGYNETAERDQNIYMSNTLGNWQAQVTASCCTEGSGYKDHFQPIGFAVGIAI